MFALCFGVILIKTDRQAMRDAAHTIILEIPLLYLHGIHTACADSSTGGAYIKYVACDYFNASADESMISYRLKEQKKNNQNTVHEAILRWQVQHQHSAVCFM